MSVNVNTKGINEELMLIKKAIVVYCASDIDKVVDCTGLTEDLVCSYFFKK